MLLKSLIFVLALWLLSIAASLVGWHLVLAVCAAASPVGCLAWKDPDRWGWLLGWSPRKSSPDDP